MSKKWLFLFFAFFPLLSYGTDFTPQENFQIGRYQIVSNNDCLFLLDTATGYVWQAINTSSWLDPHYTWVLQITAFEGQNS